MLRLTVFRTLLAELQDFINPEYRKVQRIQSKSNGDDIQEELNER